MGFRYIGSKDKLSDIIIAEIKEVNPNAKHIIDLMAGTGLFSLALRESGFSVSAVDVMTYSYHHLHLHLLMSKPPEFKNINKIEGIDNQKYYSLFDSNNYEKILAYLNNILPIQEYFYKEFSPEGVPSNTLRPRKYFTAQNASQIDAIRKSLKYWKEKNIINDLEHSLLIHDLIMATNDVANIAGTYGHYLSKFTKRAEVKIKLTPSSFSNAGSINNHKIYRGYAEEISTCLEADVCYIDPPYIKRQYAANYHILETIAREDNPEATGDSGLRPWRDQYSNFCSKVKIRDSFDQILTNVKCKDFLISYSEDGLIPIDNLIEFLSKYGEVKKKNIKYKRFKSNNSQKGSTLNEYLIHIKKT